MDDHILTRPATVRSLRMGFVTVLVLLALLDLVVPHHSQFEMESILGFGAWFGFLGCIVLIGVAKGLGWLLQRADNYYDR